ncbi:unnamed protein product [Wuchereria bancrofti]|uniref:Uncharacterized protein n=1 Tax=Wuchereria bancrofti TaxID=6293 RepID=A0A3P7FIK3_WUCBA|nr:unnamed protein product [Wuchereria bancrofti]
MIPKGRYTSKLPVKRNSSKKAVVKMKRLKKVTTVLSLHILHPRDISSTPKLFNLVNCYL